MVPGTKVEGGVAAVGVAKVDDAGELPGRWIDEDMFRPGLECRATGSVLLGSRSIRRIAAQVPAKVLVRRYPFPQNAISVAFLTSRWKAGVPVPPSEDGMLIWKSL